MLKKIYQNLILKYPKLVLAILVISILSFGFYTTKLEIDASAETLLLEDDKDLAFSREINSRFENSNFLVITYTPTVELLSDESLEIIRSVSSDLKQLSEVESVESILTVPLLLSPPKEIKELVDNVKTLENSNPDKSLVKKEFLTSPLYRANLVSEDFKTSSIIINLKEDKKYFELLSNKESNPQAFKAHRDKRRAIEHKTIEDIRAIMHKYHDSASLFLGGVNMISNDIVGFVKSDLVIYGSTLVFILIFILWIVFHSIRWVALPILICILSIIAITSSLGFFGWEITVISSNFIALQLIITISIVLHLIVRYNELLQKYPKASSHHLILLTVLSKVTPTFFAIITTIAGFSSLIVSNIKPVINLGWMMSAGIAFSFIISYIVFPTILVILAKAEPQKRKDKNRFSLMERSYNIVNRDRVAIFVVTSISVLFSLSGASMLIVENSFINYFKQDTEIYRGMSVIDKELGGTTPLDIVLTFKEVITDEVEESGFDDFEDEFTQSENEEQYWFTKEKMDTVIKIHDYLNGIEEIGNTQSLATILKIGKTLNHERELDGFSLALLYNHLPKKYKDFILSPYISIDHNQVRFATRIIDSNPKLRRAKLLKKIEKDLSKIVDSNQAEFRLTGLMVLYNNMLQSLFDSQIRTLGFVLLIITAMFLILFKSIKIALIALVVNIVPIGIIFGFMGWFGIPLDIMTITIAAIAVGIGVDDTIHYIHRFTEEYEGEPNYMLAVRRSDNSIGYAMYYTSVTIMIGFSILVLSNLVPTIYFGVLTMLVMLTALIADILLLPRLFVLFKPFSKLNKCHFS
jgi:predicted RND superfamily exporter protein